jgi:hypothetical protein
MRLRATLLIGVLAAAGAVGACGGVSPEPKTPTSPAALDDHGSSRGPVLPNQPVLPPVSNGCDQTNAQWAIGEAASDALLERARIAAGAGSARFLRPNQPVTLEYLGSRLNLGVDARDLVRTVVCG